MTTAGRAQRLTMASAAATRAGTQRRALHLQEYAIEAFLLGAFMLSACVVTALLQHPASPLVAALPDPTLRRGLTGVAMGLTAVALIYSPWGRRSGGHFNPAVTLTYWRLGKIAPRDALAYAVAQTTGGVLGVLLAFAGLGMVVAHPTVHFASTMPGTRGVGAAFIAELGISFGLMSAVLWMSNSRQARFTGLLCGALVALYITYEAPLSGMSMNPARSFASALVAERWTAFWIYCVAPPLGMLAAAELFVRLRGVQGVYCAKLRHASPRPCIFHCHYATLGES
jgi:aquaporin Z